MEMRKVGLISLGCPKNLVDSEIMLGLVEKDGYKIVRDLDDADIIIVNTCAFIEDARREAIDTILEAARYKKKNCKKLVVTGCLPQRYKDDLAKLLPEVDLFIGTGEYHKIVSLLQSEPSCQRTNALTHSPIYIHNSNTPRKLATAKHAVYIKIAEGCFHGCSFCIIPRLRGKFRSRSIKDIVKEAEALLKNGAKELNLIAQDTTSYGRDLKNGSTLAGLMKKLDEINGDFWLRIMYAYPTSFSDELIDVVAGSKKICHYFDIPIQHISDRILSQMKRKERGRDIVALVDKLRNKIPDVVLRTSLIVGFPGETTRDFNLLLKFVEKGYFNHVGVFTYSEEEETQAARLKGKIKRSIKEGRRDALMAVQMDISKRLNEKWLGQRLKLLVEDKKWGRIYGQAPDIDGITKIRGGNFKVGEFAEVKIIGANEYNLEGTAIAQAYASK